MAEITSCKFILLERLLIFILTRIVTHFFNILKLEIANNTIENLKLPNDSLIDLNESKEIQLKKQRTTIDLLQKRIDELTAKKENSLNSNNNNNNNNNQNSISSKKDKLMCDNEVCEYF